MRRIGPFEQQHLLGRGGTAEVWAVRHGLSGAELALKAPSKDDAAVREAFEREITATAALHHPNIARILDRGVAEEGDALAAGTPWFVLERASGSLDTMQGLSWQEVRAILVDVLRALGHAHGHGVLHRDIKPANVLRVGQRLVLADFGMARVHDASSAGGTPGWMAPEQRNRLHEGPWTDLYAVGHLAAWLVGEVPPAFVHWVETARALDPRLRFRSAAEALEGLENLQGGMRPSGARQPVEVTRTRPGRVEDDLSSLPVLPAVWHPLPAPAPLPPHHLPPAVAPGLGVDLLAARVLPVLGRSDERRRIWAVLTDAFARRETRSLVLLGASGVGKSRLARWAAAHGHSLDGAEVLEVRYPQGLQEAVRRWLGPRALWATRLADLDASALLEPLVHWMDHGLGPADRGRLTAELLTAVGALRRVVVVLDDAHLTHPLELGGLAEVQGPVVLLATSQKPLDPAFHPFELGPMGATEVLELLEGLVGLAPSLALQVAELAEGNPQLAAVCIQGLVEDGALSASPRGWLLRDGARLRLPPDATDPWWAALVARIRPTVPEHRSLALAALLGDDIPYDAWEELGTGNLASRMVRAHLWTEDEGGYRWSHGLSRAAVAARVGEQAPALHRQIWRYLERAGGSDARIGTHALAAGDPAAAVVPLRRALYTAGSSGTLGEVDRIDRLLETCFQQLPAPHPLRAEHLLERARIAVMRYHESPATVRVMAQEAREALVAYGDRSYLPVVLWIEAEALLFDNDHQTARILLEQILEMGCSKRLLTRVQRLLARCAYLQGDARTAVDLLEGMREAALRAGDRVAVAEQESTLAIVYHLAGETPLAEHHYRRAAELAEHTSSWYLLTEVLANHAELALGAGELDGAEQLLNRSIQVARSVGRSTLLLLQSRAELAMQRGESSRARLFLEQASQDDPGVAAHWLEHHARAGDGDAWDARWKLVPPAIDIMATDVVRCVSRAAVAAERAGWTARAAEVHAALAPVLALREDLRRSLR